MINLKNTILMICLGFLILTGCSRAQSSNSDTDPDASLDGDTGSSSSSSPEDDGTSKDDPSSETANEETKDSSKLEPDSEESDVVESEDESNDGDDENTNPKQSDEEETASEQSDDTDDEETKASDTPSDDEKETASQVTETDTPKEKETDTEDITDNATDTALDSTDTEEETSECNEDLRTGDWMDVCPVTIQDDIGECPAPCGVQLQVNEDFLNAEWSVLWFNMETGESQLSNDVNFNPGDGWVSVVKFTYEDDNNGYSLWFSNPVTTIEIENYEYDENVEYGLHQFEPMRIHARDLATETPITAIVSFGNHTAIVHDVYVTKCDPQGDGVCQNADDCVAINNLLHDPVTTECAACYEQFVTCSQEHCAEDCPGQGGNVCLHCQTDNGCDDAFMTCSGLGFMPPGTLTMPTYHPPST